jgi:hypothetical protein
MDGLPSLDDVYRRFGEVSERAQLLETELGTLLLWEQCVEEDLLGQDVKRATEIMRGINRQTLGSLIRNAKGPSQSVEGIADGACALRAQPAFALVLPATQFPQKLW